MTLSVDWRSLDTFRACANAPGCKWQVQCPWPGAKCYGCGGGYRWPQFRLGDDGEIVESRFLPSEPEEAWEL